MDDKVKEFIIGKLLSGRYLLVFAICVGFIIALITKQLPTEVIAMAIATVITFYFTRKRNGDGK